MLDFYRDILIVLSAFSFLFFVSSTFCSGALGLQILHDAAGPQPVAGSSWDFKARIVLTCFASCACFVRAMQLSATLAGFPGPLVALLTAMPNAFVYSLYSSLLYFWWQSTKMWFTTTASQSSRYAPVRDARSNIINVSLTVFKSVTWSMMISINSFDVIFLNGMVFCMLLYISSSVEQAETNLDAKVYYAMLGTCFITVIDFIIGVMYMSWGYAMLRHCYAVCKRQGWKMLSSYTLSMLMKRKMDDLANSELTFDERDVRTCLKFGSVAFLLGIDFLIGATLNLYSFFWMKNFFFHFALFQSVFLSLELFPMLAVVGFIRDFPRMYYIHRAPSAG
eukprot:TRINITY_DN305_c0_g1_i1.p1 TRINITY_DN305_c0_g1~~TRINITY_DN305_c0_g1_i1.p1  ORF type:complete len:336 (+),score=28.28 TRINITY_DN305_c0_g1_i1:146-1153(+)